MKHQFKPFDQVLVRDGNNDTWKADIFSHAHAYGNNTNDIFCEKYYCITGNWEQCVPYNKNTAHLLGTNLPYEEPIEEPKEYHVWTSGTFNEWFTKTEFENFIKTAVINNKDIKDFHVLYVKHND